MDNEFLLQDRLQKIRQIVNKYGEENFCISFSGGKDSTVLSALVDMALPNNKIPRVYADTGIDYKLVHDFVLDLSKRDNRFIMILPTTPIKKMLENEGYPFKSKDHSQKVGYYQKFKTIEGHDGLLHYLGKHPDGKINVFHKCPKILEYQFTDECTLKISDKCCIKLKEEPILKWQKDNNKPYTMMGLMREEGGRRINANCLSFQGKKLKAFQPLVVITKDWEDWFIERYHVEICAIYYPPYNFTRTGCKGCPFAPNLQHNLDVMEEYFPTERKQCETIWKPVYDEYRRLGYRLKK